MRYRLTMLVDIFVDTKEEAEEKAMEIVLGIPNSLQDTLIEQPHGSEISLDSKEPKSS